MEDPASLDELRRRLSGLDRELLGLAAERQRLSREIAHANRATGLPTRDYEREREVIVAARAAATDRGLSPEVAEKILRLLIRSSLTTQERASVVARAGGSGQRALVIGGGGRMGRW